MQPPHSPYAYTPPPPRPGWPPAARWAVGCGSCCGLLVLLEVAVVWLVLQVTMVKPPEGLKATVSPPRKVIAGRKFPLVLVIRNQGTSSFTISSLTVRRATARRLQLSNPQPAPVSTSSVLGSQVWGYRHSLQPGEKWTVRFDATAAEPGEVSGAVEVQAGWSPPRPVRFSVKVDPAPAK